MTREEILEITHHTVDHLRETIHWFLLTMAVASTEEVRGSSTKVSTELDVSGEVAIRMLLLSDICEAREMMDLGHAYRNDLESLAIISLNDC